MRSKNEKILLAVFIAWAFLHLVFLADGRGGYFHNDFWPFEGMIASSYDLTEFLVYVGGPAVIYIIYRLINTEPKK